MTSRRVTGHSLLHEGAAFKAAEGRPAFSVRVGSWSTVSGVGFGVCECGARSEVLDSQGKRKAWHRAHKAAVLVGAS